MSELEDERGRGLSEQQAERGRGEIPTAITITMSERAARGRVSERTTSDNHRCRPPVMNMKAARSASAAAGSGSAALYNRAYDGGGDEKLPLSLS